MVDAHKQMQIAWPKYTVLFNTYINSIILILQLRLYSILQLDVVLRTNYLYQRASSRACSPILKIKNDELRLAVLQTFL